METIRNETLKYCIGFIFIIGIAILYFGIWSLDTGIRAGELLVSSMQPSLWAACGLFFCGAIASFFLTFRSSEAACWMLSLSACAGIFTILLDFPSPYGIIGFLLPILFSSFLFDWKWMLGYTGAILAGSILLNASKFWGMSIQNNVFIPAMVLVLISAFILLIVHNLFSILEWYEAKYISAHRNEQIIRDNEIELQRLVKDLKDYQKYLKTTNDMLVVARNEAEKAKNTKQIFVQNVSHELRTPLNLIIGFSEAMFNTPDTYAEVNWTPELRSDVECIYRNSQHLKALIDDVLDMASLENHSYEIAPSDVDLNSIILEAALITRDSYESKGLSLKTNLEDRVLMVHADAVRIKQVILNLLSNALKYTSKGGVVICTYRQEGMAHVSVQDTGKGIPEVALGKVFESFYQVDKSRTRDDSGTGLGLFISRQLVELHGGAMKISSTEGQGTLVSLTLPLAH